MSDFSDKQQKFRTRYDRLKLVYQWVKSDEISLKEFEELINELPRIHERELWADE